MVGVQGGVVTIDRRSPVPILGRDSYGPVTTPGGVIAHAFTPGVHPHA